MCRSVLIKLRAKHPGKLSPPFHLPSLREKSCVLVSVHGDLQHIDCPSLISHLTPPWQIGFLNGWFFDHSPALIIDCGVFLLRLLLLLVSVFFTLCLTSKLNETRTGNKTKNCLEKRKKKVKSQ